MDTRLDPLIPALQDASHETGMDKEPAKIVGLVQAVLVLLVAFGVAISPDQMDAVLKFVIALLSVLAIIGGGTFLTRLNVFPAASVNKAKNEAFQAGVDAAFQVKPLTPDATITRLPYDPLK